MSQARLTIEDLRISNEIADLRDGVRETSNDAVAVDALSKAGEFAGKAERDTRDYWLEVARDRLEVVDNAARFHTADCEHYCEHGG